jgi:hypothetical protein
MITIYELDSQKFWTGDTKEIGTKDGAPIGWTRSQPPELQPGEYARFSGKDGWSIFDYYPEIIPPPDPVPQSVTMRQARLALLQQGILAQVDTVIDSLDEPERSAAKIEWEYSQSVERERPFVQALAPGLGLTDDDLDNLFKLAATL